MIYTPSSNVNTYTYLALGDSYTIGESVPLNSSFPYQLVNALRLSNLNVSDPKIVARTGWTTDDLIKATKTDSFNPKYNIVTLLIGVNNQYRNYVIATYRKEFKELLQAAINFAGGSEENVFVISIPDWGVTTFGQNSGRSVAEIAKEIDAYNAINKEETAKTKAVYLDITPISKEAAINKSLIASDGLHPSIAMYKSWVANLAPLVKVKLK
ncbi:MAG: SGNH/GDSL hydrolase family protein [Pelobium sp.]